MKLCKGCKPEMLPLFVDWNKWGEKAKHWSVAKKEKMLKKMCCDLNGKESIK